MKRTSNRRLSKRELEQAIASTMADMRALAALKPACVRVLRDIAESYRQAWEEHAAEGGAR